MLGMEEVLERKGMKWIETYILLHGIDASSIFGAKMVKCKKKWKWCAREYM
jgi:hypothetical protein